MRRRRQRGGRLQGTRHRSRRARAGAAAPALRPLCLRSSTRALAATRTGAGRTAYILAGYTIAPDPLQYVATAALVVLLVALSCALPAYLRAGCAAEMRRPRHAAKALRGAAATAAAGQGGASSQRSAGGGSSALV